MSNRAVAERYGVSCQTAHRVLGELVAEGLLKRRARSGSHIARSFSGKNSSGTRIAPLRILSR